MRLSITKRFIAVLLVAAMAACFAFACGKGGEAEKADGDASNSNEIVLTNENFDEIISGDTPILVDFWAGWCGPCMMLAPTVAELAAESDGSYRVGKVNIDEQPALAARFNITAIPTLIVFKNGEKVAESLGLADKNTLVELIESAKNGGK